VLTFRVVTMETETPKHLRHALQVIAEREGRFDLQDFNHEELRQLVIEGLGEKKYRAKQLFQWLYLHLAGSCEAMTNRLNSTREKLGDIVRVSALEHVGSFESSDGTNKLTFRCDDGAVIETVYIPSDNRNTLFIASQVGCAMGCTFCFTAKMGLKRNLTTAEIVDQVVQARRLMGERNGHIGNIVFMGMGEPLHNIDNVIRAIHILVDTEGLNFSRRRVTV